MSVLLLNVQKRVTAILLASPRGNQYGGTVFKGNGESATGRYATDVEITRAILEADARVCLSIIDSIGNGYRTQFFTTSGSLVNGASIPAHVGQISLVKVDSSPARLARSRNQIIQVIENPELYVQADKWFWTDDVIIYHNGTAAVVTYPNFTMTSACQSPDAYESAVVSGSVALLMKDGGSGDYYSFYAGLYAAQESAIRGGAAVIPPIEQFEAKSA